MTGGPRLSPELAVVTLVGPPEGVLPQDLVLLEVGAHAPALVVGQRVAVLLEQRVDARDAPVPAVLQILQSEISIFLAAKKPTSLYPCRDPGKASRLM